MESVFGKEKEKKGVNKILLGGILAAVVLIGGAFWTISIVKPIVGHDDKSLEGAYFEGSQEFAEYTKEIIISTNTDRLMQSLTGLGSVTMHIGGSVYNKGEKTLTALQVNVGVIDSESKVMKEKKFILLPNSERDRLNPGETMNVNVNIGGFTTEDDRANVRWKVTAMKFD